MNVLSVAGVLLALTLLLGDSCKAALSRAKTAGHRPLPPPHQVDW